LSERTDPATRYPNALSKLPILFVKRGYDNSIFMFTGVAEPGVMKEPRFALKLDFPETPVFGALLGDG
jgi:hypothetical protein